MWRCRSSKEMIPIEEPRSPEKPESLTSCEVLQLMYDAYKKLSQKKTFLRYFSGPDGAYNPTRLHVMGNFLEHRFLLGRYGIDDV